MTTVFVDIDTQIDFLYPAGALYVPRAERLLPAFARLNRYAAGQGITIVSTMDAHTEDDPEFRQWPPHCVVGTAGQQKPAQTLLDRRAVVPPEPGNYNIAGAQQIIVEKRHIDVFQDSNLQDVVGRLAADRWVVYGVVTEYCIRYAALGLLRTGKPVEIVADAIETLKEEDARRTFDDFTAEGGRISNVAAICG